MSVRAAVLRSLTIACAAVCVSGSSARLAAAESTPSIGTVHTVALAGGVEGLRLAIGDRRTTPPASVVIEMTRRFHGGTDTAAGQDPVFARLRRWLRECLRADACGAPQLAADAVPLPGPPQLWRDVVFERRVAEARLIPAILDRRDTSLLYSALLAMPEDARAWVLARPALVRQLRGPDAGPLLVLAPYLRIADGRVELPGGADAAPVWAALAGAPTTAAPEAALLALLRADGGLLAYLAEVVATMPEAQQRAMLALGDPDPARRVAAGADLFAGVRTAAHGWDPRVRPFWRPSNDPAFLLAQMRPGAANLGLPGGRAFWALVFGDGPVAPTAAAARAAWDDPTPVSPGFLLPKIWLAPPADQALRYEQVLFASRRLGGADATRAVDVATIVRGYGRYPQLLRVLDRLDVDDIGRLAALVRRADALQAASADWRGHAAIVRWQSGLVFVDFMVRLGAMDGDELRRALDALAAAPAVDPAAPPSRGTQARALLSGLGVGAVSGDLPARPVEDALVARLTRVRLDAGRRVTWEDQAYRLDVGAAERDRITRVRGRDGLARLDGAWAIYRLADASDVPEAAELTAQLTRVVAATRLDRAPAADEGLGLDARLAIAAVRRLLERGRLARDWAEVRGALDDLGDALATEALAEMAYAANMGWAEDLPLTALAAYRRHVFTRPSVTGIADASWQAPDAVTARESPWHVAGSLLGIGDALAPVALRRSSLKPLAAAPTLNTGDRKWLVTTVGALDRRVFTDDAQQALVAALARGEARVGAATTPAAVRALVADAGAPPLRQTLAGWLAQVNPPAVRGVLSMTEILRLGSAGQALPPALAAWGTMQRPISGRLTAGPLPAWPWERYAGRSLRLVSCALPDLALTLAARLAALDLPANLVADLMPSATYDLVNTAAPRHADDFDALAEYVRGLDQVALERHLGLLTTNGPLRPLAVGAR